MTGKNLQINYLLLCIVNLFVVFGTSIYGQTIHRNTIPNAQSSIKSQQNSLSPKQQQFQEITTAPVVINNYNPILGNGAIEQQNRIIQQKQGMLPSEQENKKREIQKLNQELSKEEIEGKRRIRSVMMRSFQNSFLEFLKMNPDSFSVTKAIYLSESAWYGSKAPTYAQFENAIMQRAELIKQILKQEGIDSNSNIAKNYGIQRLFTQDNKLIDPKKKTVDAS